MQNELKQQQLFDYLQSLKGKVNCIIDSPQAFVYVFLNNRLRTTTMRISEDGPVEVLSGDEFEPGLVWDLEISGKYMTQEGMSDKLKDSIRDLLEDIGGSQETWLGKSLFYYGLCLEQSYNQPEK